MISPEHVAADVARRLGFAIREQRFEDAVELARVLISLRANDATAWYNLAYCLRATRAFAPALEAYQRAIALNVDRPEEAMINRAAVLIEHLSQPIAAEQELLNALRVNSRSLPALLTLGQLYEDQGRAGEAEAIYHTAITLSPGNGRAHARSARLQRQRGNGGHVLETLQNAARLVSPSSDDFAEIMMGLGQAYEAEQRFAQAWAAYVEAKRVSAALVPVPSRYDRLASDALISAIIASPIAPAAHSAMNARAAPIFVCGMFRSGSTLVEQILARHPRVMGAGEMEAIPAMVADLADYPASVPTLSGSELDALRRRYWTEIDAAVPEADVVVDKRPDNFLHLGLIRRLFPNSPIVHTVRDRDDIAISIFGNLFGPAVPYSHRLPDIRHWQSLHDRLMEHWRGRLPGGLYDVVYERLVADPRTEIARMLEFCGLEWSEECISGSAAASNVRTLSQWQVREEIHARSVQRASNFQEWLGLAE